MPLDYCTLFPDECGGAPAPTPTGGGYTPTFPTFPTMQPNQGALVYPKSTPVTTLDKILASTLSGLALLTRQQSVPTTQQQQGYAYSPYPVNPYAPYGEIPANSYSGSSNTLGNVENWVKTHTFETIIGAAFLVFYLLPSPRQSRRNGLPIARNGKRRKGSKRRRR